MINESSYGPPSDPDQKYYNEDYIMRILVERNQAELEKIKEAHNLTDEQIELFSDFAGLRQETLNKMKQKLKERQETNLKASEDELAMGAYLEQIEPQVQEAVLALRGKGYTTYESGFSGFSSQKISFEQEHLKDFVVPESLKTEFERVGAELMIRSNSVEIKFNRFTDLPAIKDLWQKVETALPALDRPAKPCEIPSAMAFRQKH